MRLWSEKHLVSSLYLTIDPQPIPCGLINNERSSSFPEKMFRSRPHTHSDARTRHH